MARLKDRVQLADGRDFGAEVGVETEVCRTIDEAR